MDKKLSFQSISSHLKKLRASGFYQLNPDSPKLHKLFQGIYMKIILFLMILFTVQQFVKLYQVRDDLDKSMDTMYILLTNSDSIYKQIIFWIKADKIEKFLDIMKGPIFNQGSAQHNELLSQTVTQARRLLRAFNTATVGTCVLLSFYPLVLYGQGKPADFVIWLPFDPNTSPHIYIVVVYAWILQTWSGFSNSTMDAFISCLQAQCKTQLSILRLDLENLVERSKEEASRLSKPLSLVLEERFSKILIHYDEIIKFQRKVQEVYSGAIFYFFLVSCWVICTSAYRIVNMKPGSLEYVSMILYMCCMLTEIVMYCYYGNEVYFESELLMNAAYAMDWVQMPIKNRKDLIFFMEIIKRPIRPTAGIIIPLSNATLVSLLRTSYSYYVFLKKSKFPN